MTVNKHTQCGPLKTVVRIKVGEGVSKVQRTAGKRMEGVSETPWFVVQLNKLCLHSALGTRGTAMSKTKFLPSSGLLSSEAQVKMSKYVNCFSFFLTLKC